MALKRAATKYGVVTGVSGGRPEFTIFKGVPYAKPPVGALRFAAPKEPDPWEGERPCTQWAPMCVQEVSKGKTSRWEGSEDCLYLNIWTPAEAPGAGLPVMVWIHGGGFTFGRSSNPLYDGTAYNARGVILVTLGFRCGVFGFLGLEELEEQDSHHTSGNCGFLDILQALRWVKENIAAFGGDPGNVTIFGQSSGAMTVKMLLGTPLAAGLFQRAISMSGGGTWDIDPIRSAEEKYRFTRKLLEMAGWTFDDLMTREDREVCQVLDTLTPRLGLPQQSLVPRLFQPSMDGYLVRDYYGKILYDGVGTDVDVMCGTIREEWHNFPYQIPGGIHGYEHEFALAPGIAWGRRYIELGKRPIYHYFFDHDLPGGEGSPGHGSEMPYTFGILAQQPRPWTDYDRKMSEIAVDYWTSFARSGDPNTKGRPAWPAFSHEHPVTLRFANDGIRAEDLGAAPKVEQVVRYLCAHPGILSTPFFSE